MNNQLKDFCRRIDAMADYWFREVALRGHILRYEIVEPGPADDSDEQWSITPFNKAGEQYGEPLVLVEFDLGGGDIQGWIERTQVIYSEAELPERIRHLDVYGRASDEERAADNARREGAMLEYERELLLCTAPEGTMH